MGPGVTSAAPVCSVAPGGPAFACGVDIQVSPPLGLDAAAGHGIGAARAATASGGSGPDPDPELGGRPDEHHPHWTGGDERRAADAGLAVQPDTGPTAAGASPP